MTFLDHASWWTNLLIMQIYQTPIFSWLYHKLKSVYSIVTGKSELYRICDSVVNKMQVESIPVENENEMMYICIQESRKLIIHPDVLYRMDLCILHSSKLDNGFRRTFESWFLHLEEMSDAYMDPGTGAKFEDIFKTLIEMKKFPLIPNVLSSHVIVLRAALTEIVSTFHLLHELNSRAATRYDSSVVASEKKLFDIWTLLMPGEALVTRYSAQWSEIGFQGKDPSTDFRGMGLLALDNLYYLCEKYLDVARRIHKNSRQTTVSWFSFACVGINITAYCLRLMRTRQLQWVFYTAGVSKDVFNEVYCNSFI